jgi:hypothetical protein
MKRILTTLAAIVCLCGCQKEEVKNHWLAGHWYGEYETTVTNNDTGEKKTVGAMIELEFSSDGTECICTGALTDGSFSMNRVKYFVYVNEQHKSFFMNDGPESSKLNYAGKLSEGRLIVTWPAEVERTVELKKMKLK